jgi:hypothetical protein
MLRARLVPESTDRLELTAHRTRLLSRNPAPEEPVMQIRLSSQLESCVVGQR